MQFINLESLEVLLHSLGAEETLRICSNVKVAGGHFTPEAGLRVFDILQRSIEDTDDEILDAQNLYGQKVPCPMCNKLVTLQDGGWIPSHREPESSASCVRSGTIFEAF